MSTEITNTRPDAPRVTLFGQLEDGSFDAEVMDETDVPYARHWDNAIDQVMVYIEPTEEQLGQILNALREGRLQFADLQEYGASNGGTSHLPV